MTFKDIQTALKAIGIKKTIQEIYDFFAQQNLSLETADLKYVVELFQKNLRPIKTEKFLYDNKTQVSLEKFQEALRQVGIEKTIKELHHFLHKTVIYYSRATNSDIPLLIRLMQNKQFMSELKKRQPDIDLVQNLINNLKQKIKEESNAKKEDSIYKYIYVIADEENGVCKIGISNNPSKRLSVIQTHYPFELKILFSILVENPQKVEKYLHKALDDFRLNGEWFYIDAYYLVDWSSLESFKLEQK